MAEEGCLSLPGRPRRGRAPGERARPRPGRRGRRSSTIEAEGLRARVIQHEIDHLDGVLILDRISKRGSARRRCGRCARPRKRAARAPRLSGARAARGPRLATVFIGTSQFAAAVLERLGRSGAHRPALVITRPDRPRGRGRKTAPAAGRRARARAGHRAGAARERQRPEALERISGPGRRRRRRGRRRGGRVRLRRADQGAAAVRARDPQRAPVAATPLARGGPDRAGDHGRRRAHRASRSCASQPAWTAGRCAGRGASRSRPEDDYGTLAERLEALGAELLVGRSTAIRRARAARAGGHLRGEDRRRGQAARPNPPGGRAGAPRCGPCTPTSAHACALGDGSCWACAAPRRVRASAAGEETGEQAGGRACSRATGSAAARLPPGLLELLRCSRLAAGAMDAGAYLRGHAAPGRR